MWARSAQTRPARLGEILPTVPNSKNKGTNVGKAIINNLILDGLYHLWWFGGWCMIAWTTLQLIQPSMNPKGPRFDEERTEDHEKITFLINPRTEKICSPRVNPKKLRAFPNKKPVSTHSNINFSACFFADIWGYPQTISKIHHKNFSARSSPFFREIFPPPLAPTPAAPWNSRR